MHFRLCRNFSLQLNSALYIIHWQWSAPPSLQVMGKKASPFFWQSQENFCTLSLLTMSHDWELALAYSFTTSPEVSFPHYHIRSWHVAISLEAALAIESWNVLYSPIAFSCYVSAVASLLRELRKTRPLSQTLFYWRRSRFPLRSYTKVLGWLRPRAPFATFLAFSSLGVHRSPRSLVPWRALT